VTASVSNTVATVLILGIGAPIGAIAYMAHVSFLRRKRSFGSLELPEDEAVIIRLHGSSIEDQFKTRAEIDHFVDRLECALGNIGQMSDRQAADGAITITLLGESAQEMYARIGRVLRHASLSENATVVLRFGPPGSPEQRTHMAN
jgi:hypothetical protein